MKKISTKYSAFLISALIVTTVAVIFACGGDYYPTLSAFSIFEQEVNHDTTYRPFFHTDLWLFRERKENNINDFNSVNTTEWVKFFSNSVYQNDIDYLVYKSRVGEIDSLIYKLKDISYLLTPGLSKNTILSYSDKNKAIEFLFYLGFAKRCEPFSTYAPEWYEENDKNDPRNNRTLMLDLISGGLKQINNSKTDFIKERYIFQIERLYFQVGDYSRCYKYYVEQSHNLRISESIKFRAMGYAAGSLYKLKHFGESNYLYSFIYDNCPQMKTTAYLSFAPREESDWNESLKLAKSSREKEVLWQLLGIYKDPSRSMKEIYKLDTKSDLLDLLLVRSVAIQEEQFISVGPDSLPDFRLIKENVNQDLLFFIKTCADKGTTNKPYLWDLSAGFLSYASADYKSAHKYLDKTKSESKYDSFVQDQIHMIEIPLMMEENGNPDKTLESNIVKELVWLKQQITRIGYHYNSANFNYWGLSDWICNRLSSMYSGKGELIKAHCLNLGNEFTFYSIASNSEAMLSYMDKKDKTDFDKFILDRYEIKKTDIFEFQAVNLMILNKTEESVRKFEQCNKSGDKQLSGDPFIIHINDCHNCDHDALVKKKYTKLSFVKTMLELQDKIKTDPTNSIYCYELASGYYNMSYFGNIRGFCQTKINDFGTYFFDETDYNYLDKKFINFNCAEAEKFYVRAMELSKDSEFKAKCCFMAAKCEQNNFFLNKPKNYAGNFKAGNYFGLLKENYAKTAYYKEIIHECGYFRTFLSKN